jgi:ketol-acid reductoisomerase
LYAGGLSKMYALISETAAFGGLVNGDRVIGESTRTAMREILDEIRNGKFAQRWQAVSEANRSELKKMIAQKRSHAIESIGEDVRRQFANNKIQQS